MEKQTNPNDSRMTLRLPVGLSMILKDISYTSDKTVNQVVLEALSIGLSDWISKKYPDGSFSARSTVSLNLETVNEKLETIKEEIFRWGSEEGILAIFRNLDGEE